MTSVKRTPKLAATCPTFRFGVLSRAEGNVPTLISEAIQPILIVAAYRVVTVMVGLGFAICGYSLFRHGLYEKAGDLKAAWGDRNLSLTAAAPGTFFTLFGAAIVAVAVWRGADVEFQHDTRRDQAPIAMSSTVDSLVRKIRAGQQLADDERKEFAEAWDRLLKNLKNSGETGSRPEGVFSEHIESKGLLSDKGDHKVKPDPKPFMLKRARP